jgi:hypothetical protein
VEEGTGGADRKQSPVEGDERRTKTQKREQRKTM